MAAGAEQAPKRPERFAGSPAGLQAGCLALLRLWRSHLLDRSCATRRSLTRRTAAEGDRPTAAPCRRWFQEELPAVLKERDPAYLTKEEYVRLVSSTALPITQRARCVAAT